MIAPDAYEDVLALDLPMPYRWRFSVDAGRPTPASSTSLVPDLRRLKTDSRHRAGVRDTIPNRTGLAAVVDRYLQRADGRGCPRGRGARTPRGRGRSARLIAFLIVRRRRAAIVLARGRGASGGQLLWAQLGRACS